MDYPQLKKSLAAVNWARQSILTLYKDHLIKVKRSRVLEQMNTIRRSFYGRVSSVMKQVKGDLKYLSRCKKEFKNFPTIKDDVYTVAIAGFPNVGKSTLLRNMTSSTPEVNAYPFTTKQILMGHIKEHHHHVQVLDTPGTLNRMDKMNTIEKQAYLGMKYCADVIVYIFDLTLQYPIKDQERLLKMVQKYGKEIIIYFSKTDLVPAEEIRAYLPSLPKGMIVVTLGADALRKILLDRVK